MRSPAERTIVSRSRAVVRAFVGPTATSVEIILSRFEILSEVRSVEVIASGREVRDRRRLNREYGRGVWRKLKGVATVRLPDGTILEAELHWYEAHGIGKKEIKFKKPRVP